MTAQEGMMASLTIRDIPEDLFERFKEVAKEERRSLNAEAIEALDRLVQHRSLRMQRKRALEELDRIRESQPPTTEAETLKMLREDRDR